MTKRFDTYCGLYCGACVVMHANENDEREKYAKEWGCTPEDLICKGCKSDVISSYCIKCEIRHCAQEKGIDFCFECGDYPCKYITDLKNDKMPHHSIILKNMDYVKENGVENWLAQQAKRWKCKVCGTKFSWYEDECKECGEKLYNCVAQEKDL